MCGENEKYEVIRNILRGDYKQYSLSEISTINVAISQIYINIPREVSGFFFGK